MIVDLKLFILRLFDARSRDPVLFNQHYTLKAFHRRHWTVRFSVTGSKSDSPSLLPEVTTSWETFLRFRRKGSRWQSTVQEVSFHPGLGIKRQECGSDLTELFGAVLQKQPNGGTNISKHRE